MQQRRLRLGDILDDYCPRERRITNHAVVAMIEEQVKQTRCTTCDADHEYKEAKGPTLRRKKVAPPLATDLPDDGRRSTPVPSSSSAFDAAETPVADELEPDSDADSDSASSSMNQPDDEGPVHRPLIRATLPRPEGQVPERKAPDFTMRQPGGRSREGGPKRNGRQRGRGQQAQGAPGGPMTRFGGTSQGPPRQGSRQRADAAPRGGRPPGQARGPRPSTGRGPKRGR